MDEQKSREVAEDIVGMTPFHPSFIKEADRLIEKIAVALASAADKARMEERERCAKLICEMCENALPLTKRNDGSYWHDDPEGAACEASDIRQVQNHEKKP